MWRKLAVLGAAAVVVLGLVLGVVAPSLHRRAVEHQLAELEGRLSSVPVEGIGREPDSPQLRRLHDRWREVEHVDRSVPVTGSSSLPPELDALLEAVPGLGRPGFLDLRRSSGSRWALLQVPEAVAADLDAGNCDRARRRIGDLLRLIALRAPEGEYDFRIDDRILQRCTVPLLRLLSCASVDPIALRIEIEPSLARLTDPSREILAIRRTAGGLLEQLREDLARRSPLSDALWIEARGHAERLERLDLLLGRQAWVSDPDRPERYSRSGSWISAGRRVAMLRLSLAACAAGAETGAYPDELPTEHFADFGSSRGLVYRRTDEGFEVLYGPPSGALRRP